MNMEITKKDASLLIGLFGVLVAVVVYYFVFVPYTEKADSLKSENISLNSRVQTLQLLANDYDNLLQQTKDNQESLKKILDRFPSDVKEEDMIMLAVQLQSQGAFDSITGLSIGEAADVYAVTDLDAKVAETVDGRLGTTTAATDPSQTDGTEEGVQTETATEESAGDVELTPGQLNLDGNYVLRERTGEITGTSSYEGFKQAIQMLTERNDRTQINVMASYDIETGLLDSSMTIIADFMTGTGKPYVAPAIPFVPQGTGNIFGTVDLTKQAEDELTDAALADIQQ